MKKSPELKPKFTCKKCGYKWNPKSKDSTTKPKECPDCKSRKWN